MLTAFLHMESPRGGGGASAREEGWGAPQPKRANTQPQPAILWAVIWDHNTAHPEPKLMAAPLPPTHPGSRQEGSETAAALPLCAFPNRRRTARAIPI